MKKEWYIFINSSHIGPYSLIEIKGFYEKRDIKENTLIWKEGMTEWLPLNKVESFSVPISVSIEEVPPPLPPDVFRKTSIPLILKDSEIDLEQSTESQSEVNDKIKKKPKYLIKIISFILSLVLCFAGVIVYQNSISPDFRIKGISPYNREQLQKQLSIDQKNIGLAIVLTMDKSNLWIATNQNSNLVVTIDLKAEPGRLLRDDQEKNEEIEVRLQGKIANHLGHFTSMKMLKGTKFFPGEYNVHVIGKKIHWLNQYLKLNLDALNLDFTVDYKNLIFSGNTREFERKLIELNIAKKNLRLRPLQDKLEILQTLKSLNEKNSELFKKNLEVSTTGKKFAAFEQDYLKEISPIVQVLVLTAVKDLEKNPTNKRLDEGIIDFGKKIGELASQMITEITPMKKISKKTSSGLSEKFMSKADAITTMISVYIGELEIQIKEVP